MISDVSTHSSCCHTVYLCMQDGGALSVRVGCLWAHIQPQPALKSKRYEAKCARRPDTELMLSSPFLTNWALDKRTLPCCKLWTGGLTIEITSGYVFGVRISCKDSELESYCMQVVDLRIGAQATALVEGDWSSRLCDLGRVCSLGYLGSGLAPWTSLSSETSTSRESRLQLRASQLSGALSHCPSLLESFSEYREWGVKGICFPSRSKPEASYFYEAKKEKEK